MIINAYESVADVINRTIGEGLNMFCYRMPGAEEFRFGCAKNIMRGIAENGFVCAPFDNDPDCIFTIPSVDVDMTHAGVKTDGERIAALYPFPEQSTSEEHHASEVESIVRALGNRVDGSKTVAARVELCRSHITEGELFESLANAYPSAFVFCFHTRFADTWIGATPETLLRGRDGVLTTMALAGTRQSQSGNIVWDVKNINEQKIVENFITAELSAICGHVETDGPFTQQAGPVEHLCTLVRATDRSVDIESILRRLSPTPALCGYPRDIAMRDIMDLESTPRGYYGGYVGPVNDADNFDLFVNLRSCRIRRAGIDAQNGRLIDVAMFAGGGIMPDSNPRCEWLETERKLDTIRVFL